MTPEDRDAALHHVTQERDAARAEVARLTVEQGAMEARAERLVAMADQWAYAAGVMARRMTQAQQGRRQAAHRAAAALAEVERLTSARELVEQETTREGTMQETETDWQPIETAPTDATWVLLWDHRDVIAVSGYWDAHEDDWMTDVEIPHFLPTHWRPFSPGPVRKQP
jgi:hypothetical protein